MDILEGHCNAVSDPGNSRRGKYLLFHEVGELVRNPTGTKAVISWAKLEGFEVVGQAGHGEYVLIRGLVHQFGKALSTTFHHYKNDKQEEAVACAGLVLPMALKPHISGILGAIHTPMKRFGNLGGKNIIASRTNMSVPASFYPLPGMFNGTMTPQKIKSFYNVDNDKGSESLIQDIFSAGQLYTLSDLQAFRGAFDLDATATPENVGTMQGSKCYTCKPSDNWFTCLSNVGSCMEASLDVQYLTSVSQLTRTRVHNFDASATAEFSHALVKWLFDATRRNDNDLALVHSISYGIAEADLLDQALVTAFNNEAIKLCARGVSIFVAAGDGGVCDGHGDDNCGYKPVFPASSPWVTAVGGTMGPESNLPEIVMNVADSGSYTAGGGFSEHFHMPAWQKQQVSAYLQSSVGKSLAPGFNATNRAYPDVAFASNNFAVVIGGILFPMVGGTSASAPAVAGLFSLINARLKAQGKESVGFVNPTLYAAGTEGCCNDITQGANMCMRYTPEAGFCELECMGSSKTWGAYMECSTSCLDSTCKAGFVAAKGWDAASGLGSPDFQKLLHLFGVQESSDEIFM